MRYLLICLMLSPPVASAAEPTLMEMNDPAYLLEHSGPWTRHETEHFIFHFSGNVKIAPADAQDLFEQQERNWRHLVALMQLDAEQVAALKKVNYWLFASNEEKRAKTQVESDAHSLHEYWSVYYRIGNASGVHEIGHLLASEYWSHIPQDERFYFMLNEGWAWYVDEGVFWNFDFRERARDALRNNPGYRLSTLCCAEREKKKGLDYRSLATVSGAFVKFLVETRGVRKFGDLYRAIGAGEDMGAFESTYGQSFESLETAFYADTGVENQ